MMLSVSEAAKMLNVQPARIYRAIQLGQLKATAQFGGPKRKERLVIAPEDFTAYKENELQRLLRKTKYNVKPKPPGLSLKEVAPRVGLCVQSLRNAISSGQLGAVRFGRRWFVTEEQLEVFVAFRAADPYTRKKNNDSMMALNTVGGGVGGTRVEGAGVEHSHTQVSKSLWGRFVAKLTSWWD